MGYMRHHAIIVTSYQDKAIDEAHEAARNCGLVRMITPIYSSPTNGYRTFVVLPDGSTEGWHESHAGDEMRTLFIDWLNKQRYDDGSSPLDWVEVQYGDDDGESKICRHSDDPWFATYRRNPDMPAA